MANARPLCPEIILPDEDRDRALGQLEAMMVPQSVKPWTTHSACKPTSYYSTAVGIERHRKVISVSEAKFNWSFEHPAGYTHYWHKYCHFAIFGSEPCVLVQRISYNLIYRFSFCFRLFIRYWLLFSLIYKISISIIVFIL